jgi:hypothetical protein
MKQTEGKEMEAGCRASRYVLPSDELTEASRWEGYEFWSAQVEANLDLLDILAESQPSSVMAAKPQQPQEASDVFPF